MAVYEFSILSRWLLLSQIHSEDTKMNKLNEYITKYSINEVAGKDTRVEGRITSHHANLNNVVIVVKSCLVTFL